MNSNNVVENKKTTIYAASQWKLIWWRFRKHKLAIIGGITLIILYTLAIFAPFFSPHDPNQRSLKYRQAPPQRIRFINEEGFRLRPFVYPLKGEIDMETLDIRYAEERERPTPVKLFTR